MLVRITSKRQVTLPAHVLEALGVGPGDQLELLEGPDGYTLRAKRIDLSMLGGLRDKIAPGTPPFDIRKFRDERSATTPPRVPGSRQRRGHAGSA